MSDYWPNAVTPAGRVVLTPRQLSEKVAARRVVKPLKLSTRAIAARLKAQRREDAVLAPQRPVLDRTQFNSYLRDGSI